MTEESEERTCENVEIQEIVHSNPMEDMIRNITRSVLPIVENVMSETAPVSSQKGRCDRCGSEIEGEEPAELFIPSGPKFVRYYLCRACASRAINP